MFDNIPERFASETADTEEEAARWLAGDKDARRPPELLTRDVVARAIRKEVKAGRGSPHGGAFLNIAIKRNAEDIKKKLPSMYHQFKVLAELDITTDPMEVGPTLHYMMGGIRVDADTQMSRVPGLFACGECSGGMHGANRLGGNSLSDLLVFGKLAGVGATQYLQGISTPPKVLDEEAKAIIRNATNILNRESGNNPYLLHDELEENMQSNVGIVRTAELLTAGIAKLENLKESYKEVKAKGAAQFNPGWHEALALRNLIITTESVTRAALMREESRGAHTRVDFPGEQDEWLQSNVVIHKGEDGKMVARKIDREKPSPELERIANLSMDELEKEVAGQG
jgi:succinate dehydrogenase / fumarate reductase flavoprotein subunit